MIAARVDAGISQKEMAKLVDRSNNTVLAWEKGNNINKPKQNKASIFINHYEGGISNEKTNQYLYYNRL